MLCCKAVLMDEAAVMRALRRISFEIVERNRGCENVGLVGICRRGVPIAGLIADNLYQTEHRRVPTGQIDIAFYRDDIREKRHPEPVIQATDIGFDVTGRDIVLVDDVLYTGRTVRAAIDALMTAGRPASVQLAILCDRGHRELPIRADYIGKNIPTSQSEMVVVKLPPYDDEIRVELHEEG